MMRCKSTPALPDLGDMSPIGRLSGAAGGQKRALGAMGAVHFGLYMSFLNELPPGHLTLGYFSHIVGDISWK